MTRPTSDRRWRATDRIGVALLALAISGSSADAAECNAFEPVPQGATWVYQTTQGGKAVLRRTVRVKSSSTEAKTTNAVLEQTVSDPVSGSPMEHGTAVTSYRCDPDGTTLLVSGTAGGGPSGGSVGTVKARLAGLPPAAKLVPEYRWRSEGDIETTEGASALRTEAIRGSGVEAIEPVEVPAGKFPKALRIASVETLTLTTGGAKRETRQHIVDWVVAGIGLVKRQTSLEIAGKPNAATGTEELVSFSGLSPVAAP